MPKKQSKISVVALSPKTKKPLRVIRKNQEVIYGVRGPKGGIKVLSSDPQKFFKTDLKALNKAVSNTDGKSFIIHKQLTRQNIIDPKTKKPKLNKDGTPKKAIKITGAKPKRKQKPVLYVKGRPVRDLDIGYKKGNYVKAREIRKLTIAKPNVLKPIEFNLKGDTIKQALEGLHVDVGFKSLMTSLGRLNLYYNIILKIYEPNGNAVIIPVNGAAIIDGFPSSGETTNFMNIDGKREPALRNEVRRISNLKTEMAFAIRRALKDSGFRFTSLAKLKQIAARNDIPFVSLKNIGVYPRELTQLTNKYKVVMYVRFEVM